VLLQELFDDTLLKRLARSLQADCFLAPGNSRYHLGLISRHPITAASSYRRFPFRISLLEATIALPRQKRLRVWGVHLMPYFAVPFELWRMAEIRTLLKRARGAGDPLALIAGDFNAIAPGDRVRVRALPLVLRAAVVAQGGRVYRWALSSLHRDGWIDCYRRQHPLDAGWTLPSHRPNARLDYVFVNPLLASRLVECSVVTDPELARSASDHLPVRAVFALD
jgi:endonuclease/exonuclease/phosphatase family metal-dependent hydrolase